jgi:hypothetical protein
MERDLTITHSLTTGDQRLKSPEFASGAGRLGRRLGVLDGRAVPVFAEGRPELFLGVHDDRALPCDGLAEGFSGNEKETEAGISGGRRLELLAFL